MSDIDDGSKPPTTPFRLFDPHPGASPVVFSSPHSGRHYPDTFIAASRLGRKAIRRSEDAYVEELLSPASQLGFPLLTATYARAFVDLNRDPYELDQSMFVGALPPFAKTRTTRVAAGLGSIARIVAEGQEIYREKLPVAAALERIDTVHKPYHAELDRLLSRAIATFGFAILIDWHSMPSLRSSGLPSANIVLGDRFGASCSPTLTTIVEGAFRALDLTTARNSPFAGGYTTEFYGRPEVGLHALQVEIDRSLYIDEDRIEPNAGFNVLQKKLKAVAAQLAGLDWLRLSPALRPSSVAKLAGE